MAAEAQLTAPATTHPPARTQDPSPGRLSEPGCGSGKSLSSAVVWLAHTTALHVGTQSRRRLDLIVRVRGDEQRGGGVLRCQSVVLARAIGARHPRAAALDAAVLRVAERRKRAADPELARGGFNKAGHNQVS